MRGTGRGKMPDGDPGKEMARENRGKDRIVESKGLLKLFMDKSRFHVF